MATPGPDAAARLALDEILRALEADPSAALLAEARRRELLNRSSTTAAPAGPGDSAAADLSSASTVAGAAARAALDAATPAGLVGAQRLVATTLPTRNPPTALIPESLSSPRISLLLRVLPHPRRRLPRDVASHVVHRRRLH